MSGPANPSMLTVIVGEDEDGWIAWVAPGIDNTMYVAFTERATLTAVYRAAREAGWSATDLATLNYTWRELSRRAISAIKHREPIGFDIGAL